MKLNEITDKEGFINMLKNPEAEKVRKGLEELADTFRKSHWNLTYKLEEELNRFKIRIRPVDPIKISQLGIEDLWMQHHKIIKARFPTKHIDVLIMSRLRSVVGFYLIIDDTP